jgi:hypothetical protein
VAWVITQGLSLYHLQEARLVLPEVILRECIHKQRAVLKSYAASPVRQTNEEPQIQLPHTDGYVAYHHSAVKYVCTTQHLRPTTSSLPSQGPGTAMSDLTAWATGGSHSSRGTTW